MKYPEDKDTDLEFNMTQSHGPRTMRRRYVPSPDMDCTAAAHTSLRLLRASGCISSQTAFVTNPPWLIRRA